MKAKQVGAMPIFFIFVVSLCLLPRVGEAATITVNCPTASLQAAVDGASGEDVIEVSGTCNENVVVRTGKVGITLDGQGIATVNGADTAPTLVVVGRGITIQHFTITGGIDGIVLDRGGTALIDSNIIQSAVQINPQRGEGILVADNSTAKIINNVIQAHEGSGIAVVNSSFAFIGAAPDDITASPNTIQNNGVDGVRVLHSSSAVIVGNNINNNGANGVRVVGVSQAEIEDNTINGNGQSGIFVSQNSGVNLGHDTGSTIFDLPNQTTVNNIRFGIECSLGAYADGRLGTLNGASGKRLFSTGCINSLIP